MKPAEFLSPTTLNDALELKHKHGAAARVIAGGTDLILRMRAQVLTPSLLIDLQHAALNNIKVSDKYLEVGASLTISEVLQNTRIEDLFPAIHMACRKFAGPPIRNRATIGGNIVNASPAADLVSPLIAYDAEIVLKSANGERTMPLVTFFTGAGKTLLKDDEILTQIRLPLSAASTNAYFIKLAQRNSMAISQLNLTTRLNLNRQGLIETARIVLGSVAAVPMRAMAAEAMLVGEKSSEDLFYAAAAQARQEVKPISDIRASREYRLQMTQVLVRRALLESIANV
ncbi:MAG: xanthine dehydrogenase family protein subunit M [Gammaproteobacteria bacterium]|nr:xanthine dehydrogenase family protein subunit M [Gammaproteobacteria bacterium]